MNNGLIFTRTIANKLTYGYSHICANGDKRSAGGFKTPQEAEKALSDHKEKCGK